MVQDGRAEFPTERKRGVRQAEGRERRGERKEGNSFILFMFSLCPKLEHL